MRGLSVALLLLIACGDDPVVMCPEGFARVDGVCVETNDAGPDAIVEDVGAEDASDAGPDVMLPCGMECSGMTPMCREADMTCVQCLTPADCAGMGDAVMCSEAGLCVECTENSHCDEAGASVCSTEGITAGSCVACTAGSATDCEGIAAGSICDDASGSGVCVECNAGDETACGMDVCDVDMRTCSTGTMAGMTPTCGECVSDRQCRPGHTCAPTTFGGMDAGHYCLWDLNAAEMAPLACSTVRPFGTAQNNVTTRSGATTDVCRLTLSTCPAYNDFRKAGRGDPNCTGEETPEADADCGHPDLEDGFCVVEDIASNRCTTQCTSSDDCVFGGAAVRYVCDMDASLCTFVPE